AGGFLDAVDLRDVRMIQRRQQPRLALEPRKAIRIGRETGRQDLDRDVASQLRVARAIHFAHAAHAEQPDDFVDADPRLRYQRNGGYSTRGPNLECGIWNVECVARIPNSDAASELDARTRARAAGRRDRRSRKQAGEIDDVQAIEDVGDLAANLDPAPAPPPYFDSGAAIDRHVRVDASFCQVDAFDDRSSVMLHEI